MSCRPSRVRDRVIFILVMFGVLCAVAAWRSTGPLTVTEQIEANEGM